MRDDLKALVRPRGLAACILLAAAIAAAPAAVRAQAPAAKPAATAAAPAAAVVLDTILKELAVWDGGIESAAFWKLRDYVRARKDDPAGRAECEAKLLLYLKSPTATPAARMAASRHLRVIAGDTAVPALQAMLADDRTGDLAIYVLQQIPGKAAGKALVAALPASRGAARISIIAALGERRDPDAIAALVPLLAQPDVGRAAALALGTIGGPTAADAVLAACAGATPELKTVLAGAAMRAAEQSVAAKRYAEALRVYESLLADGSLPPATRQAAALGRIAAAGPRAGTILMEYLGGSDPGLQEAAIARLFDVVPASGIGPVCEALPRLPAAAQVELLAALTQYPKASVLPTVRRAAESGEAAVRIAAFNALAAVGDESVAALLIESAARTKGPEQAAARSAIGMLRGDRVDQALLTQLSRKPEVAIESELLLAVADRQIFPAKGIVVGALGSPAVRVRVQALKALRAIGTPSDIPAVLDRLVATSDDSELTEVETTAVALAAKYVAVEGRGRTVIARLQSETARDARVRLLGVLALIGDSRALPSVRVALADADPVVRDAAIRAIASWPNGSARDDVVRLARDTKDETQRLLAIRGMVRLVALDRNRLPSAVVADLQLAATFCSRAEERRLVLGALGDFACPEALELAKGFLQVPGLEKEAKATVDRITTRLKTTS
jgi:HEAT repeat protein